MKSLIATGNMFIIGRKMIVHLQCEDVLELVVLLSSDVPRSYGAGTDNTDQLKHD